MNIHIWSTAAGRFHNPEVKREMSDPFAYSGLVVVMLVNNNVYLCQHDELPSVVDKLKNLF